MPEPGEIVFNGRGGIVKVQRELDDTGPLMKKLGIRMLAESQEAFKEQRLGDFRWPEKYPTQEEPFINIAGALEDFNDGRSAPQPRQFRRRPALVSSGDMLNSLSYEVLGPTEVQEGTNKKSKTGESYPAKQQAGGKSRIDLTDTGVEKAKAWLFTKYGKVRKGKLEFAQKLAHSIRTKIYVVRIYARPFVGFTENLVRDIIQITRDWITARGGGKGEG